MSEFPKIQDLPDDGSQQKEVYAAAGLALYTAQVWERGMLNLALIMRRAKEDLPTVDDWDKSEDALSSLTAGGLRRTIEKEGLAPTKTLKLWKKALDTRNALAHGFFYKHAAAFMVPEGRQLMLDELEDKIKQFELADEKTRDAIARTTKLWGITEEDIETEGQRLVEDFQNSL